ncbi:MAG: ComF family protein [Dinoroseobacter sp.]|nr:ComF family protein [Dinoroseobacter sp.]
MFQGQLQSALRTLYPPVCVTCESPVTRDFGLCSACLPEMPFISGGICGTCGVPLSGLAFGQTDICDSCLQIPRPWTDGRAAATYADRARTLVLQLKHGDRSDLARPMGAWLAEAARPLLKADTLLVPVPLHRSRLLRRKYNQAVLLARQVSRHLQHPMCPDLLIRTRKTLMQDHRGRDERFANLDKSISVSGPRARKFGLTGRHILLVDDVMSSGATLGACAITCLDAGARQVDVAVFARSALDEFTTGFQDIDSMD